MFKLTTQSISRVQDRLPKLLISHKELTVRNRSHKTPQALQPQAISKNIASKEVLKDLIKRFILTFLFCNRGHELIAKRNNRNSWSHEAESFFSLKSFFLSNVHCSSDVLIAIFLLNFEVLQSKSKSSSIFGKIRSFH